MEVGALRQAFSILLVFALLGFALWKLRRPGAPIGSLLRKPAGGARALQSLERLALTPHHALHLVRVQGREIVIATHPQGCTVVTESSEGACA